MSKSEAENHTLMDFNWLKEQNLQELVQGRMLPRAKCAPRWAVCFKVGKCCVWCPSPRWVVRERRSL